MIFFLAGFGLLLHILFWGAGVALLLTPRPWRRHALLFAPVTGVALQSAVVWFGALSGLEGTNAYALWSEVIPVVLLLLALWRMSRGRWRALAAGLKGSAGVWLAVVVTLNALLIPMSSASKTLTTMSLGSCDAADYAAGVRVLQEFGRGEREGFIAQEETVAVGGAKTFFEYWLRLNHFTPSALGALNNSVFGWKAHETISVLTAVLMAASLPGVFWLARAGLRLGPVASVMVACFYGASPVLWYAVYHVAIGQLLAAQAVALLTWAGVVLWRAGAGWRAGWRLFGLMVAAYWVLLGAYNFILLVALVPAAAYAGGCTVWGREWRKGGRWLVAMLAPLALAAVVFNGRVVGLVERFQLLRQYDFGWKIPALTPEGWLGIVGDEHLNPLPGGMRVWVACGVGALLMLGVLRSWRWRERSVFLVFCLSVPILAGYGYLLWRGARLGTNASYDAYKLLAVFYPGILAAVCWWLKAGGRGARVPVRIAVCAMAAVVLAFQLHTAWQFDRRMKSPPLMVDRWLVQLERVEGMARFTSFNMLPSDGWSRLWANYFLLRKNQYFATHTYEGRLNTELKGDWDLLSGVISIRLPEDGTGTPDYIDLSRTTPGRGRRIPPSPVMAAQAGPLPFSLVNTRSEYFLRAGLKDGWFGVESIPRAGTRWRWTRGDASIRIENSHDYPLKVAFRFNARSVTPRELQIWAGGRRLRSTKIGAELTVVRLGGIEIPPGESVVELRSDAPAVSPGGGDGRLLGFAIYGAQLDVLPRTEELEP